MECFGGSQVEMVSFVSANAAPAVALKQSAAVVSSFANFFMFPPVFGCCTGDLPAVHSFYFFELIELTCNATRSDYMIIHIVCLYTIHAPAMTSA
jgi:hypothetical protein